MIVAKALAAERVLEPFQEWDDWQYATDSMAHCPASQTTSSEIAPDGIEPFEDAWARRVEVEGFPVCHPDDIIASKAAANRVKDRESLPRLRAFRDYWVARHPTGG
jgi:hypothetical protein